MVESTNKTESEPLPLCLFDQMSKLHYGMVFSAEKAVFWRGFDFGRTCNLYLIARALVAVEAGVAPLPATSTRWRTFPWKAPIKKDVRNHLCQGCMTTLR